MSQKRVFILLFLVLLFPFSVHAQSDPVAQAKELLQHAATYNWLARARHGDSRSFLAAEKLVQEAVTALQNESNDTAITLRLAARAALEDLAIRYENNFDNIVNEFPLFPVFTGSLSTYEFVDDPSVTAITHATEAALETLPDLRQDLQYTAVVISSPPNAALEDEVFSVLTSDPRVFPRYKEEIIRACGAPLSETGELPRPSVLNQLARSWGKQQILVLQAVENDTYSGIHYHGIHLKLWSVAEQQFVRTSYHDGFAEDKRDVPGYALRLFLISIAIGIVVTGIWGLATKGHGGGTDVFALLLIPTSELVGVFVTTLILLALGKIAPEPVDLAILPVSRLWIAAAVAAPIILGFVFQWYLVAGLAIMRRQLNRPSVFTSVIFGVLAGAVTPLLVASAIRFHPVSLITTVLLFGWLALISIWAGQHVFQYWTRDTGKDLIALLGLLIASVSLSWILWANKVDLLAPVITVITGMTAVFEAGFVISRRSFRRQRNSKKGATESPTLVSLERMRERVIYPDPFIDPLESGTLVGDIAADVSTGISVLLIHGSNGTGKTRLAREVATAISDGNPESTLFGDCDELNSDGSGVPFEPFSQAFHDLLGAGRFEPSAKRAAKINAGVERLHLDKLLEASGMGPVMALLGVGDDEETVDSGTIEQMAGAVAETMIKLARRHSGRSVLIIDDIQWIDSASAELLRTMLTRAIRIVQSETIAIILTQTDDGNGASRNDSGRSLVDWLEELGTQNEIAYLQFSEGTYHNPARFSAVLTHSIGIERKTAQAIIHALEPYEPYSIQSLLQIVKTLDEKESFVAGKQGIQFADPATRGRIPPPREVETSIAKLTATLTEDQYKIVECAAFIGYEFNAEVMADVLGMDRLRLLHQLRDLEAMGIISDVVEQDDVYTFVSRSIPAAIRHIAREAAFDRSIEVPQIVREYHFRIAQARLKQIKRADESIDSIPINSLISLSRRSWAAGDRMIDKAFQFNFQAGKRTFDHRRYRESVLFARQAIESGLKSRMIRTSPDLIDAQLLWVEAALAAGEPNEKITEMIVRIYDKLETIAPEERPLRQRLIDSLFADFLSTNDSSHVPGHYVEQLMSRLQPTEASDSDSSCDQIHMKLDWMRVRQATGGTVMTSEWKDLLTATRERMNVEPQSGNTIGRLYTEIAEDYGEALYRDSAFKEMIALLDDAISIKESRNVNDAEGAAKLLVLQGRGQFASGLQTEGRETITRGLDLAERIGASSVYTTALMALADVETDHGQAIRLYRKAYLSATAMHSIQLEARALAGILENADATGNKTLRNEFSEVVQELLPALIPFPTERDLLLRIVNPDQLVKSD